MTRAGLLSATRFLHTFIYGVMASSTLAVLCIGVSGEFLPALWIFLPLLAAEIVVFVASGLKCPLTAVVDSLTGDGAKVADTYLPERLTRHTLALFGPLLAAGFLILAARWMAMIVDGARP